MNIQNKICNYVNAHLGEAFGNKHMKMIINKRPLDMNIET